MALFGTPVSLTAAELRSKTHAAAQAIAVVDGLTWTVMYFISLIIWLSR